MTIPSTSAAPTTTQADAGNFAPRRNFRAFDQNQARAWPGRKDPCNMAQQIQPLLQVLVDQVGSGNLTTAQLALAKNDLAMIATRSLCQGHVGEGRALSINVNGQVLQLDAIDLTLLLNQLAEKDLNVNAFETAAQNRIRHIQTPQKTRLENPEGTTAPSQGRSANNIQRIVEQPNLQSPLYKDMNALIRQAPAKAFDREQQLVAKQVIDMLQPVAQGQLRGLPAQLIGVHEFVEVMRVAARNKQLPAELQQFRDSCAQNESLKKAIYCNPKIAARILGLSIPSDAAQPSNQTIARGLANEMVETATRESTPVNRLSKLIKRVTFAGYSLYDNIAKRVFTALGNYAGFGTQEMADVPSCFEEIECPAASRVAIDSAIHANVVSMGNGRHAVAAMQPLHSPDSGESNLPAFYQLLTAANGTTVFDLRSNKDFSNGSFNYCPEVGFTRVLTDPKTREQIQVTTLAQKLLKTAESQQFTVRIQVGNQAPKEVKVIQFKNWPDHGVITPKQLRSLSSLLNTELNTNQHAVTHCRAGVGRTGTLLAYENLRHDLIDVGRGKTMVSAQGEVDENKLLQAITEVVAQGRIERGPYFVQSEEQFMLLRETLKADLQTNAAGLHTAVAPPPLPPLPPRPAITAPGHRIGLSNHPASNFAPEPASNTEAIQHWQSILAAGEDVVEIVSTPDRLVGASEPANSGLGAFLDQITKGKNSGINLQLGNKRLLAIKQLSNSQNQGHGQPVHQQQFEIQYQEASNSELKTLRFTQFLTPFDGLKLTASQLNDITELLGEAGYVKPKWLTSVVGVGRPSALLLAQTMRQEIQNGSIGDEQQLLAKLGQWIEQGRATIGPLFIHSNEQRLALVELGKSWLNTQQA